MRDFGLSQPLVYLGLPATAAALAGFAMRPSVLRAAPVLVLGFGAFVGLSDGDYFCKCEAPADLPPTA